MYLALSIFTGFLVALMIQLNGILQTAVGGMTALMAIHTAGMIGVLTAVLLLRVFPLKGLETGNPGDPELKKRAPWYYLGAGMIGTALVFLTSVTYIKGGILVSLSGSLAGQTLSASVLESFYARDREKSPLLQRLLAPGLLIPGSLLIGLKADVSLLWILISWSPGVLLMVQQSMNAANTLRWGTPRTVFFNYFSSLLLITPLFFILGPGTAAGGLVLTAETAAAGSLPFLSGPLASLPWYIIAGGGLIGVFTTGSIAILLLKAPALMVILGIYIGELSGGIVLDLYNGNPIAVEKMIGILLIAAGLASGKVNFRRRAAVNQGEN